MNRTQSITRQVATVLQNQIILKEDFIKISAMRKKSLALIVPMNDRYGTSHNNDHYAVTLQSQKFT